MFLSPPELASIRANKAAVKELLAHAKTRFERVIWEPPVSWDADAAETLGEGSALVARDPLKHGISSRRAAYYRMPGPAGYKSRYEDPALEKLADLASRAKHDDATYVFANVDMFSDARRFRKLLED